MSVAKSPRSFKGKFKIDAATKQRLTALGFTFGRGTVKVPDDASVEQDDSKPPEWKWIVYFNLDGWDPLPVAAIKLACLKYMDAGCYYVEPPTIRPVEFGYISFHGSHGDYKFEFCVDGDVWEASYSEWTEFLLYVREISLIAGDDPDLSVSQAGEFLASLPAS